MIIMNPIAILLFLCVLREGKGTESTEGPDFPKCDGLNLANNRTYYDADDEYNPFRGHLDTLRFCNDYDWTQHYEIDCQYNPLSLGKIFERILHDLELTVKDTNVTLDDIALPIALDKGMVEKITFLREDSKFNVLCVDDQTLLVLDLHFKDIKVKYRWKAPLHKGITTSIKLSTSIFEIKGQLTIANDESKDYNKDYQPIDFYITEMKMRDMRLGGATLPTILHNALFHMLEIKINVALRTMMTNIVQPLNKAIDKILSTG